MRRMRVATAAGMAALVLGMLGPSGAFAAQRYASPTGTGASPCAAADPCSVIDAANGAATGDEIIVAPGDYALTASIDPGLPVTLHGVAGLPRPKLTFSGGSQFGVRLDSGGTARYLEIVQAEPATVGLYLSGATGEQLIVRGSVNGLAEIQSGSTLQNSIVLTSSGTAATTATSGGVNTSFYRNVTAISTDPVGYGLRATAGIATGRATINAFNVIAKGGGGGAGLRATTDSSGAQATINATNSNFSSTSTSGTSTTVPTPGTGTNQATPPLFVNAAGNDYHQATGSPTIGAGSAAGIAGSFDVDGDPRSVAVPDIGADEYVEAPAATTDAASAVGTTTATLNATVDAKGAPTTYYFDYGPTDAYGSSTAVGNAGSGTSGAGVSAVLSGLAPGTTYHFRVTASNAAGTVSGSDLTFTTGTQPPAQEQTGTQTPPPTPLATPDATPKAFAGMALATRKLKFRRGFVIVTLRCPAAAAGGSCSGRLALTALTTAKAAATVLLGRATFRATAGGRVVVRVRVTKQGRALLNRSRSRQASLKVTAKDGAGQSRTRTYAVTIKR